MNGPSTFTGDPLRLLNEMRNRGFDDIELIIEPDDEFISFSMKPSADSASQEGAYQSVLSAVRQSGFRVGEQELALSFVEERFVGGFLTVPFDELVAAWEADHKVSPA